MLINQNQISPDTMSCAHLRGHALCLRSWLHSYTKLSHPCRLTQASAGSPDSSTGCWCQGVYLTNAGQPCPPRARWTLQQDRWYRRELWTLQPPPITAGPRSAGYVGELQTHLLCNAFFLFSSPTRSAATELVGDVSFSCLCPPPLDEESDH